MKSGLNVTEDQILNKAIHIKQPQNGFRVGSDSILLAAAVPAVNNESVIDIGSGVGAISLCVAYRCPKAQLTALEKFRTHVELFKENIIKNNMLGRINIFEGVLENLPIEIQGKYFSHVVTNPPFWEAGKSSLPKNESRRNSSHEGKIALRDWISLSLKLIKPGGSITIIVPDSRSAETLSLLRSHLSTVFALPLVPRFGLQPKRWILQGWAVEIKCFMIYEPFQLHTEKGNGYSDAAEEILRGGNVLELAVPLTARDISESIGS